MLALLLVAGVVAAPSPVRLSPTEHAQVIAGLSSDAFKVRMQAAMTLGEQGSPESVTAIARLLSDPEPAVRATAAVSLGRLGAPAGIEPLTMAAEDPDDFVRAHVRQALFTLARPESFDRLWTAAQTAGTHGRRTLAEAITRVATDPARIALLPLSADADPGVREVATQALVGLPPGERAALLVRGLSSPVTRVRMRSAALIARLRVTDLIPSLASVAARVEEIDEVRRVAKRALWELRDDVDVASAREALASVDATVEQRVLAAVLLGVCGKDRALGALDLALAAADARLRWVAAQALADCASAEAAAAIRSAAGRELDYTTRLRLEQLARDAGQPPAWQSIALGN